MAHYTVQVTGGASQGDHPTGFAGAELALVTAQGMAIAAAKKHRGSTATVIDATGAVVFTAGPFPAVSSQGT